MGRRMDDAVATVDSAGLVTALTTGMADIEAKIPLPNRTNSPDPVPWRSFVIHGE